MPISEDNRGNSKVDYKQKYLNLKRKLKLLIYENESYSQELMKSERQLLQVCRDKSYLLDRLLQYEKVESTTSDSEDTLSSDSEVESRKIETKKKKTTENVSTDSQTNANTSRKKKTNTQTTVSRSRSSSTGKPSKTSSVVTQVSASAIPSTTLTTTSITTPLIKTEVLSTITSLTTCSQSSKASVSSTSSVNSTIDGHMTSEELERHLESRRQPSALLMPEKTPLTVPVELFSNESSNGLPEEDNHLNLKSNH